MDLSGNRYVPPLGKILDAGFNINSIGTTRCHLCRLEVSQWPYDMDPFTIHAERSPNCVFVRSKLSTIDDIVSQNPSKRQKIGDHILQEVDELKRVRQRTFSHWPYPKLFLSQMIKAGFFSCNNFDRVICIYCNRIYQGWNTKTDDPYEIHKQYSPNCSFVKSMLQHDAVKSHCIQQKLPYHIDYVGPEQRTESFMICSVDEIPSIDKLVDAGFFYDGSKIVCFYCNGSFEKWQSDNHPIAEHVQRFPHCNYAKQLCGEELHGKTQLSIKNVSEENGIHQTMMNHDQLDDDTRMKEVAARLDLPISRSLLEKKQFQWWIIECCWSDQLRLKHDDFHSYGDLWIACEILRKQIESIHNGNKIIILSELISQGHDRDRQTSSNNEHTRTSHLFDISNPSSTDIFEKHLEKHKMDRQQAAVSFVEDKEILIQREKSLYDWPFKNPSRRDITEGGWMLSQTKDYLTCPHCNVNYYNWKPDDKLFEIHKYLSPNCLFVLSPNPLNKNSIPIRKIGEQFNDEDIINAESQKYKGLVRVKHGYYSGVYDRRTSFDKYPGGCPNDSNNLALSGFYYNARGEFIQCFYCSYGMWTSKQTSCLVQSLKQLHTNRLCHYHQQVNDHNTNSLTQTISNICTWCMVEEKRLMALPCRHFSLCQLCGQIKHTCPICSKDVDAYNIIYSS